MAQQRRLACRSPSLRLVGVRFDPQGTESYRQARGSGTGRSKTWSVVGLVMKSMRAASLAAIVVILMGACRLPSAQR